jgi:hypothetical protein
VEKKEALSLQRQSVVKRGLAGLQIRKAKMGKSLERSLLCKSTWLSLPSVSSRFSEKQIRREKQKGCKQKKIRKKIQQILEVRLERERERVKSGSGGGS